jgi:hypothetical protein
VSIRFGCRQSDKRRAPSELVRLLAFTIGKGCDYTASVVEPQDHANTCSLLVRRASSVVSMVVLCLLNFAWQRIFKAVA